MDLAKMTIQEARVELDKGRMSSEELTRAYLDRIQSLDATLHACLLVDEKGAIEAAKAADKRLQAGETGGLLGIPYLAKDNMMTKGLRTTAASKILENYIAPYDATAIKRLRRAGAVLLGKTNLDEFAHGASTENSAYGPTKNPWDTSRVPGGSSGGSAAAVAAGLAPFALGSDTGGSIRQPAGFCNLIGLKPSYGRVSRFGLLSMTSSTDIIGPLTKNSADAAMVLNVIAGQDRFDASSLPEREEDYSAHLDKGIKGMKIGVVSSHWDKHLDPDIREAKEQALSSFRRLGAEIMEIELPYSAYGVAVYYVITPSEISSNLARFDGVGWGLSNQETEGLLEFYKANRGHGFGAEVKRRIMLGTFALSSGYADAYYKRAQAVRDLIKEDYERVFKEVDLIISPTSPHPAFKLGEKIDDPLAMYLEDIYLSGPALAGLPAMSVPAGFLEREGKELPFAWQLIAPYGKDEVVLQAAAAWEKTNDYINTHPQL